MTLLSPPFLLELHSFKVDGSARRPLLSDISFTLAAGERLAVIGPNGYGKSTLLKTLVGERRSAGGEILLAGQLLSAISRHQRAQRIAYLAQHDEADRGYALRTTSPSVACRTTRASRRFPAANVREPRWPARWRKRRSCCCWMNRRIIWIRSPERAY